MGMIDIIEDSIRKIIKERSDKGSRLKEQKNTEVKKDKKGFNQYVFMFRGRA